MHSKKIQRRQTPLDKPHKAIAIKDLIPHFLSSQIHSRGAEADWVTVIWRDTLQDLIKPGPAVRNCPLK
jgi:hypothetical protein